MNKDKRQDKVKTLKRENQAIRELVNRYDKIRNDDKKMIQYLVPDDAHFYSYKQGMDTILDSLKYILNKR
jgi:hypothetical protein